MTDRTGVKFKKEIGEEVRPWGKFRSYPHRAAGSLKIITVSPGRALSLQYHRRRSEFWVVLDAGLEMTLGKRVWRPKRGEEIFIPSRMPHRLQLDRAQGFLDPGDEDGVHAELAQAEAQQD